MMNLALMETEAPKLLKLDIGCGTKKQDGFIGLDCIKFDGVDHILDVGRERWPFENESVAEGYTSHFVEHLDRFERIHFCNELYRVLIPGGKCTLIVPHWSSSRAYGDPTHQWPAVSEFWFYYLSRKWRLDDGNAPHDDEKWWVKPRHDFDPGGFKCDFDCTWGYGMHPTLQSRNAEYQQFALNFYKEAVQDVHATLTKK